MAELHQLHLSSDFIKWIFGVIRDESWDSCFSFLMITNKIHEKPTEVNWKINVAFNRLWFRLFILHTDTCVIFLRVFLKGFWFHCGTFPSTEFPQCPIFLSYIVNCICCLYFLNYVSPLLTCVMVFVGHHP